MLSVQTMPRADAALANDVSANQSEINRENERAAAVNNGDGDCHDSSSIIGASLLQFLPDNGKGTPNANGDEILTENRAGSFQNWSPKRSRSSLHEDRDRCKEDNNGYDLKLKFPSLIFHGGTIVAGTHQPQPGNRRQRRRTSRKRILLRGPPRSGKTSLSMNLAYFKAEMDRGLPSAGVSVIVYRPVEKNNNETAETNGGHESSSEESDPFPLFCRALPAQCAGADQTMATSIHGEDDEWDSETLNRIRICRVSSVRELLEDMLVLAGKPEEEQPTRAIIIEDLDQIIELGRNPSDRSHFQNANRRNKNYNDSIATLLKTVAIASDTALAIENKKNKGKTYSSRPNRITLLITLTNRDARQSDREASTIASGQKLHNKNGVESGDILAVTSCIDTVVTLSERRLGNDNPPRTPNNNTKEDDKWKIPVFDRRSREDDDNIGTNQQGQKTTLSNGTENIKVNSVWRADIQERGCDQSYLNVSAGYDDDTNGVSLVDYAFVESIVSEENGIGERDRSVELRWKDDTGGT